MKKLWLIAKNEYQRNVFKKSFILALLSVPLIFGLNIGLGLIINALENNNAPVGYVDHAGLLVDPLPSPEDRPSRDVSFLPFKNENEARQALSSKEIQAYYVLSSDYDETGEVELVYLKKPGENATRQFYDFLQINLLADYPPEIARRAAVGIDLSIRSPDGIIEIPAGGPKLSSFLPLIISFAFMFLLMMSSGYLMGGVVEEKENRMMEVLTTSASPAQIVAGKVLGIIAISLTQLVTWVVVGALAVFIGGELLDVEWLQNMTVPWVSILKVLVIAVPSYVFAAGMKFTIGSTLTEAQEGQSVSAVFFMLYMLPLYLVVILIEKPNSPLPILFSLLPFTSLLTVGMRSMFSVIPVWQIAITMVVQVLCALGAIWLGARTFRLGMLRYGQRLKLSEILSWRKVAAIEGHSS
ncbi:MAG: ABC transporter permease [Anaerolineales bacterium]|nr:ABC transporter permease [Anaerolineales bacterium]